MTINERAIQLWPLLALAARNQQLLSYATVGKLIGMPNMALSQCLDPIYKYCKHHKLPPLTAIVVSETSGLPTGDWIEAKDILREQARVFVFDWLNEKAPSADEFAKFGD